MSEVKPTLVYYDDETPPLNSWLGNFPTGKWIDAQSRNWYWIMTNVVAFVSAYEYRVKFDNPVENATLIFPFVVKTSDEGVKKVFIDGVEYQVRSKENYGNMFVVSGKEFRFKVATRYKLRKQAVPILAVEYKQAVFRSVEFSNLNYIRLRHTSSGFNTAGKITTNYIATRRFGADFITSNSTYCNYIAIRTVPSMFSGVNSFSVPTMQRTAYQQASFRSVKILEPSYIRQRTYSLDFSMANAIATDYTNIRNIYTDFITSNSIYCDYVIMRVVPSVFGDVSSFSVPVIANCRDTSWARFGGVWSSCDTWMPLT